MKQMKLFLVALLTVVMGVSVTSCMGDENTVRQLPAFAKCINTFPPTFQIASQQKLIINDASLISLNVNDVYVFWYEYDSAEQPDNSPTLNVKLYGGSTPTSISASSSEGPMDKSMASEANSALYTFNSTSDTTPGVLFDQEYVIVPVVFWVKVESSEEEQKKEIAKHSFVLTYDNSEVASGATEMTLTLNHVINTTGEDENVKRNRYTSTTKAYKLQNAIYDFQSVAGNKPTSIKIKAKVNNSDNSLKNATDAQWNYTIK